MENRYATQDNDTAAFLRRAGKFFLSSDAKGTEGFYPLLLAPYRNLENFRYDYPIALVGDDLNFQSAGQLLAFAVNCFAQEPGQARALKAGLGFLEDELRQQADEATGITDLKNALEKAITKLEEYLDLKGEDRAVFLEDLQNMRRFLPEKGGLLGFSNSTPFYLLSAILESQHKIKRKALFEESQRLITRIKNILSVEESKKPEQRNPEKINSALGYGAQFINPETFASFLPHQSSSELMSKEREKRFRNILETLENFISTKGRKDAIILLPEEWYRSPEYIWDEIFPRSAISMVPTKDSFEPAIAAFDRHIKDMARLFSAIRQARLELNNEYSPELHDDFFQNFSWHSLSEEELFLCPPVILIEDEKTVMNNCFDSFSRLFLSGKPVKIMLFRQGQKFRLPETQNRDQDHTAFPQEAAQLISAYGKSFVLQSCCANPEHFIPGLMAGLSSTEPALFHLLTPPEPEQNLTPPWLWCRAANESRYFPFFSYTPRHGLFFGGRFDIKANSCLGEDWVRPQIPDADENESLPCFTFADFLLQEKGFQRAFLPVPENIESDRLIPLPEFLRRNEKERLGCYPFIEALDREQKRIKLIISYDVALFCLERSENWGRLQELGGSRNFHAELAATEARKKAMIEQEELITALKAEHELELEKVRAEATESALERIAGILLNPGLMTVSTGGMMMQKSEPQALVTPQIEETPPAEEEEEELISEEPWIASFACTSCNECTNLNPRLFKYNADKQAVIADVNAGTYEQLVIAAENCPVKCIHPGKPLNMSEPNIEDLIKRAEAFQ
jgi:ferredoxin